MSEIRSIAIEGRAAADRGEPVALATLLSARGSSFRRPGARVLFLAGRHAGALSGGCLERDLAERVPAVLAAGRAQRVAVDTGDAGDALWGTASGCGGAIEIILEPFTLERLAELESIVEEHHDRRIAVRIWTWDGERLTMRNPAPQDRDDLAAAAWDALAEGRSRVLLTGGSTSLVEVLPPPVALTLFGGGADAAATANLALRLGWDVTLVDPALAGAGATFAGVRLVEDLESIPLDPRSAVLVMTHSFHRDVAVLGRVLAAPPGYVGVLGPRRRTNEVLAAAGGGGRPPATLRTPAGLDIGGESPEEIALSLIAEIQAHVAGRGGRPLSSSDGPIHEPVSVAAAPEVGRR